MYHAKLRTVAFWAPFSLMTIAAYISWPPALPVAFAEQLISLGQEQEKAQTQTTDIRTNAKTSSTTKESKLSIRKPHKLIRKPQQSTAALVQIPSSTSEYSPGPTGSTPSTTTSDSTTLQTKDTTTTTSTTTTKSSSTSLAVAPTTAPSTTTTSIPFAAATFSPTTQTSPIATPLAGIAAAGSSTSGSGSTGGRGMQRLVEAMPGLTQLITPTTSSVAPTAPATPKIGQNPASLAFSAVQNAGNPASQSVTISNSGTGTLNWTATSTVSWLTLNGASSTSGTNSGSFAAGVNISGLSAGTYNGSIAISAVGATNTPQSIPVTVTITAAPTPTIGLSATTFSFTGVQGASNPSAQTLTITNMGSGTLSWTASESATWLTPSIVSGTGTGSLTLNVSTAGMTAGTYSTPLIIAASGATNTPQTVVVNLTITTSQIPTISLSPMSLAFSATQGGGNPTAQTVTINNSGTGTLSWSVSTTAPWLSLSPPSGTAPSSFTATANISGLAAGSYSSTITVTGSGATNTPQSILVALTITAAPTVTLNVSPTSLAFTATQGAANPANQSFTISSNTSWTVSQSGSWLAVSPTSGSNNGTVTVSVNTATATVGTNSGTITVTGGGITRTINVTLTLNSSGSSSAFLSWAASTGPDVASYRVYQSTTSGIYGAAIATIPAGTLTYTAAGLAVGNTYYFRITAVDSANNESDPSNEVSKSIF